MRWLLIVLLVSLVALLVAAAGGAWHIWSQRARIRSKAAEELNSAPGTAEQTDAGTEF
jgi:Flp pilus assembly protein TadB